MKIWKSPFNAGEKSLRALCFSLLLIFFPISPSNAQLASEPWFNLDLVDMYVELFPEKYEAEVIANIYLNSNGSDPVMLRCEGNFKKMTVRGEQANLSFRYNPPYFWLYNLASGPRQVDFYYRVRHDGLATSGAVIATNRLDLPSASFWYPRNNATDPHQVILNIVSDPNYAVYTNGSKTRDIPNNFKQLRTFLIAKPSAVGMILKGTP